MASTEKNNLLSKLRPYIIITSAYIAILLILLIIFDNFIMPAVISSGERVRVPYLIGKNINKAQQELERLNLKWRIVKETYSDKYPSGTVISQMPSANLSVKTSRPILLTLSKGQEKISVPYLLGSDIRSARLALAQRGLELGDIAYEFSDAYPKDIISKQSVSAGMLIPYGSKVDVFISKGPESQNVVPMLIGYSFEEVKSVIEQSGFVLGLVQYRVSETYLPNTLIDQSPKAGEMAQPGTEISITVSK